MRRLVASFLARRIVVSSSLQSVVPSRSGISHRYTVSFVATATTCFRCNGQHSWPGSTPRCNHHNHHYQTQATAIAQWQRSQEDAVFLHLILTLFAGAADATNRLLFVLPEGARAIIFACHHNHHRRLTRLSSAAVEQHQLPCLSMRD